MKALLVALAVAAGLPATGAPNPTLEDLARFPPYGVTDANADFASAHKNWLYERRNFWLTTEERDYWQARYDDQYWRWDVWTDLRLAQQYAASGNVESARDRLRWIRNNIGDDAFYRGEMPLPCAIWHFRVYGD